MALFDSRGYYLGWIDQGHVWGRDGTFFDELVDGCYVLRSKSAVRRGPSPFDRPTSTFGASGSQTGEGPEAGVRGRLGRVLAA